MAVQIEKRRPMRSLQTVILAICFCAIAVVAQQGIINTVAGSTWNFLTIFGTSPGSAANAPLGTLLGVASDTAGNVYAADSSNHIVVKVSPQGTLTALAGTGVQGYSGDGGAASSAALSTPSGLAVDTAG